MISDKAPPIEDLAVELILIDAVLSPDFNRSEVIYETIIKPRMHHLVHRFNGLNSYVDGELPQIFEEIGVPQRILESLIPERRNHD